jgi:FdhE protein
MIAANNASQWDQRIARAQALIDAFPAAAEPLAFYAALAGYQKSVVDPAVMRVDGAASFREALDSAPILDVIPAFLAWLPSVAPAGLSAAVAQLRTRDSRDWAYAIRAYCDDSAAVSTDADRHVRFVVEAMVQPFAGAIAASMPARLQSPLETPSRCPVCGSLPVVSVLREEGHGARRSLVCSLCFTEWHSARVRCVACGEETFDRLPVYTAEQYASARIDACDCCRSYVKTIDLTKDGLAVPCVDDIGTLTLDLWAGEQGYRRLKANLLGY